MVWFKDHIAAMGAALQARSSCAAGESSNCISWHLYPHLPLSGIFASSGQTPHRHSHRGRLQHLRLWLRATPATSGGSDDLHRNDQRPRHVASSDVGSYFLAFNAFDFAVKVRDEISILALAKHFIFTFGLELGFHLDASHVHGVAKVVTVLGFCQPRRLTGGLAGYLAIGI